MLALLPFAAGTLSLLLVGARLFRRSLTPAAWCFCAGMAILGVDSLLTGLSLLATQPAEVIAWLTRAFAVKSVAPAAWLAFSLIYSRGDYRRSLSRWRGPLVILAVLPIGVAV